MADEPNSVGDTGSDDSGTSSGQNADSGSDDSQSGGTELTLDDAKNQLDSLTAKVDDLVKERNRWKGEAKNLREQKTKTEREAAEKSGDKDALIESLKGELEEAKNKLGGLENELFDQIALGQLRKAIGGKAYKPDQVEALLKNQVTIHVTDSGEKIAAVKAQNGDGIRYHAGEPLSIEKFVSDFLAENDNLAVSQRRSGTGAEPPGNSKATDGDRIPTIHELNAMDDGGAAWIEKNRDKLAKVDISKLRIRR